MLYDWRPWEVAVIAVFLVGILGAYEIFALCVLARGGVWI